MKQIGKRITKNGEFSVGSRHHLASFFGVSTTTIERWLGQSDFPEKHQRRYCLSDVAAWVVRYYSSKKQPEKSDGAERLRTAKAELAELKLARERGEVVDLDLIDRTIRRYLTAARIILESIPDALLVLCPDEIRAPLRPVLTTKINEILGALQRIPEGWEVVDDGPSERPRADELSQQVQAPVRRAKAAGPGATG